MSKFIAVVCLAATLLGPLGLLSPASGQAVVYRGRVYRGPVCNSLRCSMCNAIRAMQSQAPQQPQRTVTRTHAYTLTQTAPTPDKPAKLEIGKGLAVEKKAPAAELKKLPADAVTDALANLRLTSQDVFADVGCGDGQILITAVRRYRCRAIGIEIVPKLADQARANVAKAEKDGKIEPGYITIVTGNAITWDPRKYGITAATAYLFPTTLEQVAPALRRIPRVSVPFHQVKGMQHVAEYMECYLYVNP